MLIDISNETVLRLLERKRAAVIPESDDWHAIEMIKLYSHPSQRTELTLDDLLWLTTAQPGAVSAKAAKVDPVVIDTSGTPPASATSEDTPDAAKADADAASKT